MAKKPSPWWWAARRGWYVLIDGQRHYLGEHPADLPPPQKSRKTGRWNAPSVIDAEFHKLLTGDSAGPAGDDAVVVVLDDFISWCRENRAVKTADRYEDFIQDFVKAPDVAGVKLGQLNTGHLTTKHVTQWLNERPGWGTTTKRNAITALQRGFNWAVKNRGLARNPIRGMEKPAARRRTAIVTPAEFETLLTYFKDSFRDLFIVSYDSGARPFEVKELEARHVELDKQRAVIPADEAKGGKHPRTIYFPTARSMEILQRLHADRPTGPLFLNRRGNKWTAMAVKCRLEDLDHVLGRRVTHYALRHSFVTRKLLAGVDSHVVASLAGHRDTSMIDRVYSHVADDHAFMLEQARKDLLPESAGTRKKATRRKSPSGSPASQAKDGGA